MSRQRAAALGLTLAVLGLSHRLAFVVSRAGIVLLLAGIAILAAVALLRSARWPVASVEELNLVFTGLLLLMVLVGAIKPYRDDPPASGLVILGALLFFLVEPIPVLRRYRLWIVTPLLLAAHGLLILHMPFPKQDVFRFLTLGVDGLFHHGLNPYQPIPDPVSSDVLPYTFTYPPGALVLVAPFRLLLGRRALGLRGRRGGLCRRRSLCRPPRPGAARLAAGGDPDATGLSQDQPGVFRLWQP